MNFARTTTFFLLFLAFLPLGYSSAQDAADARLIRNQTWKETEIKPGLVWRQANFQNLFNSVQEINMVEIDLNHPERQVVLAGVAEGFMATSAFAQQHDALAAINASFFNTSIGGSVTRIVIDGKELNQTTLLLGDGRRNERANGALILDKLAPKIIAGDNKIVDWDHNLPHQNLLVSGPVLMLDAGRVNLEDNAFNKNRHPRSVAAIFPDGKLLLMVVDGRSANAQGMSLHELAFLLETMGVSEAINLDGGGSSALYIKNQTDTGIVSYPSDNKLFDHAGERRVANAILIL